MATKAQKEANLRLFKKRRQKILDATNNGRCWWLYQQLIANPRKYRTSE